MSLFVNSTATRATFPEGVVTDVFVVSERTMGDAPLVDSFDVGIRQLSITVQVDEPVPMALLSRICRVDTLTFDSKIIHVQPLGLNPRMIVIKCKQIDMTFCVAAVMDMIDFALVKTEKIVIVADENYLSPDVNCGGYCLSKRLSAFKDVEYKAVHNPFDCRSTPMEDVVINVKSRRQSRHCIPFVPCVCIDDSNGFFHIQSSTSTFISDETTLMLVDAQRVKMFSSPCLSVNCLRSDPSDTTRQLLC